MVERYTYDTWHGQSLYGARQSALTVQVATSDNAGNVIAYARDKQHTFTFRKPGASLAKPAINSWYKEEEVGLAGTVMMSDVEISTVSVDVRKAGETGNAYSFDSYWLCSNSVAYGSSNYLTFTDSGVPRPWKQNIKLTITAADIHGNKIYWHYLGEGNCGPASECNFDQFEYEENLYKEELEIAILSEDVLGSALRFPR
ncbi:MAG: hypothetical protein H7240_12385 [Glaciimonas sp.]|nr:hypothetical protein [Glaciimonas sp.]